jgi:long-chain acyl-CoA synthetase
MFNLSFGLEDASRKNPDKAAILSEFGNLTFAELNALANRISNALISNGLKKGDKVALSCPNHYYFPAVYYGVLKAGGVVVPLSIMLKRDEIRYHLKDSNARFYFCYEGNEILPIGEEGFEAFSTSDGCREFISIPKGNEMGEKDGTTKIDEFIRDCSADFESAQLSGDDTAVIIYTSGTTGRPKGAELSHSNLAWNAELCRHLFKFDSEDITMTVLPMFHIFGQTCLMNSSILHGITNVVLSRFDPGVVLEWMQAEGVTFFAGVPTMYWALLNHVDDMGVIDYNKISQNLKFCVSGGASLPVRLLEDFEAMFHTTVYEGYGMSEGSPVVTFNHPGEQRKTGSIGIPVWGVEVKIVDENDNEVATGEKGQLLYRGHNVMKGYHNQSEESELALKGGWMHSGDIAYKDEDGFFFIVDRSKDMILRGGLNVYPREIEELMMKHEAVSLVAVVGVPDDRLGEEIKAFVVLNDDVNVDEMELIEWTKERIALYKYPRFVEFVEKLPTNATGKILKRKLRENR